MTTGNVKGKVKSEKWKILTFAICSLQFAIVFSGCVAFQVGGEINQGRAELLYGDPKVALVHFQRAAELDPNYRLSYSIFPEGVWTYVGRAYYAAGRMPEARQALERARSHEDDNLAKLYLGLVLAQDGDRPRGLKEIEGGLQGISDWYDYVEFYHPEGRYWDPGKYLRREIQKQIAALKGSDVRDLRQIASLGRDIEREIDKANEHRFHDLYRDGGNDRRQP